VAAPRRRARTLYETQRGPSGPRFRFGGIKPQINAMRIRRCSNDETVTEDIGVASKSASNIKSMKELL
jgi:hypothetical protein